MNPLIFIHENEALGEKRRFIDEKDFLNEVIRTFPEKKVVGDVYEEQIEHAKQRLVKGKNSKNIIHSNIVSYYVVKIKN